MIRLLLLVYALILPGLAQAQKPVSQDVDDSATVREIQELDQSRLEFDFFEESNQHHSQSDEDVLLQALELLEQSALSQGQEKLDEIPLYRKDALSNDADSLPDKMDEEIDSSLDQELSEELFEEFEEQFNEEDYEDLQDEFEEEPEQFIEDHMEFFNEI